MKVAKQKVKNKAPSKLMAFINLLWSRAGRRMHDEPRWSSLISEVCKVAAGWAACQSYDGAIRKRRFAVKCPKFGQRERHETRLSKNSRNEIAWS